MLHTHLPISRLRLIAACLGWLPVPLAHAVVNGEPGTCDPPCRAGFMCKAGRCASLCNPPCGPCERCVKGDCEAIPHPDHAGGRYNYLGLLGVFQVALDDSARHQGEVRIEFGGKYTSFQLGPAFGKQITSLRTALLGHIPFQVLRGRPFYLIPTIALGYSFGWVSEPPDLHVQEIFLVPGLRLRYDLIPRMALIVDLVQVQVSFLRLESSARTEVSRVDAVPVTWNFGLGLAFLY